MSLRSELSEVRDEVKRLEGDTQVKSRADRPVALRSEPGSVEEEKAQVAKYPRVFWQPDEPPVGGGRKGGLGHPVHM